MDEVKAVNGEEAEAKDKENAANAEPDKNNLSEKARQDIEFLKGARENIIKAKKYEEEINQLKKEERKAKRDYSTAQKEVAAQIDKALKDGRNEACSGLEAEVNKLQKELDRLKSERAASKEKGVADRISRETEYLYNSNKSRKADVVSMFKRDKVPALCRNPYYLALFAPKGIIDLIVLILTQLAAFGLIPMLVYFLIKNRQSYHLAIIYVVAVLLFGGGYILILYFTRSRYGKYIRAARDVNAQIRINRRKIKQIRKNIINDEDESGYNLTDIDNRLSERKKEFEAVSSELEAARKQFDEVTSIKIKKDIEDENEERLNQLSEALRDKSEQIRLADEENERLDMEYEEKYMERIEKDYLKEAKLDYMIELLENGDVPSIESAVLILKSMGK